MGEAGVADIAGEAEGELPLYEVIYRVLRQNIADALLPPGLVIGEAAVARAFGSSRVPAAAALRRLQAEGLLAAFEGRGLVVAGDAPPLRLDLVEAGLVLPETLNRDSTLRTRRARIYPEVEHIVASTIAHGRFLLNESLLAEHYGVSRTVAHEILARLDRAGLVTQDRNQRWYAGPLTPELMQEHFEVRWLMEPFALAQAMPLLDPADLATKRERVRHAHAVRRTPARMERLEHDLHVDTVLRCHNGQLRDAIHRSQLPLIAIHDTFQLFLDDAEIVHMLGEHIAVYDRLIARDTDGAMKALEHHLKRSLAPNVGRLERLGPLPDERRVPFLIEVQR
mgnify:CR=1 FL=1